MNASGGTPPYEYSLNGGPYQAGATFSGLSAGTYTLYVRDANGCVAGPQTVTITEPAPLQAVVTNVTQAVCRETADGSATIAGQGGTPPYQYSWVGLPQFAGSATISGVLPGAYYGVVVDANGCQDTVEVQIPYRSYVDAAVRPVDVAGCVPLAVSWVALPSGVGPYRYEWDLGDGTTATDSVVVHVYPVQGSYSVRLIIRNADGCADTAVAVAQAFFTPLPTYTIEPDTTGGPVVGTVFTLTSVGQNVQEVWWVADGYGRVEGPVLQLKYDRPGEYCYALWVRNGSCVDSAKGCIRVRDPYVYLPNAFSPNGDGVNDVFEVKAFGLKEPRVRIYDRWGVLVFDNQGDMTRHWDGTYQGRPAPEDAYTVVIEGKLPPYDKPIKRSGTVTVVR